MLLSLLSERRIMYEWLACNNSGKYISSAVNAYTTFHCSNFCFPDQTHKVVHLFYIWLLSSHFGCFQQLKLTSHVYVRARAKIAARTTAKNDSCTRVLAAGEMKKKLFMYIQLTLCYWHSMPTYSTSLRVSFMPTLHLAVAQVIYSSGGWVHMRTYNLRELFQYAH